MGALPSQHDHVGHMDFAEREARCRSCGQSWWLKVSTNERDESKGVWIPNLDRGDPW